MTQLDKSMFVYKITNKLINKCYVGKTTKSIEKRFNKHKTNQKGGIKGYLYDSMRKNGFDNFSIELIEEVNSEENVDEREKYWIKKLNTMAPNGYNLTSGGEGGDTSKSPNYIKAIKKRDYNGKNNPMFGRCRKGEKRHPDTGKNISESLYKHWEHNTERKKKASNRMIGKNNPNYGKISVNARRILFENTEYPSLAEAHRDTGRSVQYIKKNGMHT